MTNPILEKMKISDDVYSLGDWIAQVYISKSFSCGRNAYLQPFHSTFKKIDDSIACFNLYFCL